MKIDVFLIPGSIEAVPKDVPGVIIDVLRASSSIITALENGCGRIIPTDSTESAKKLAVSLGGGEDILLCGERKGQLIEGFHIGNSPAEYTAERVGNRILIYTTTNGTGAILRCKAAEPLYIGGFLNVDALADHLVQNTDAFFILCAGNNNQFSLDDTVCAGMLVGAIQQRVTELELTDSGLAALNLYQAYKTNLLGMMRESEHGQTLINLGMEDDLSLCAQTNVSRVIPTFTDGRITATVSAVPD